MKEAIGYRKLKVETLDRILWRTCFGTCCLKTDYRMNEWTNEYWTMHVVVMTSALNARFNVTVLSSTASTYFELETCRGIRSQWSWGLRCRCEVAWCLGSRLRIPLRAWMFVCCVCFVLCRYRSRRQADHSFREVLPGVCVCVCVSNCACSINLKFEAA
jgi:hypothetical protein